MSRPGRETLDDLVSEHLAPLLKSGPGHVRAVFHLVAQEGNADKELVIIITSHVVGLEEARKFRSCRR